MKPVDDLHDRDAVLAHFGRHAAERLVDAVLHVDGGEVLVAIDVERHRDRRKAAVGARRGHVGHALDAVDRLLERRGHGALDRLRVGAGVERRHRHRRRRQLRIARDRQRRNRHRAREDDQQRADRRQDGPANKDVGNHDGCLRCLGCLGCLRCGAGRRRRHHRRAVTNLLQARRRSAARRPTSRSARRSRCR